MDFDFFFLKLYIKWGWFLGFIDVFENPNAKTYKIWVYQEICIRFEFRTKAGYRQQCFNLIKDNRLIIFCSYLLHHKIILSELISLENRYMDLQHKYKFGSI